MRHSAAKSECHWGNVISTNSISVNTTMECAVESFSNSSQTVSQSVSQLSVIALLNIMSYVLYCIKLYIFVSL